MDTVATSTEPEQVVETAEVPEAPRIEQELLVEDVSIDGMCGVY